MPRSSASIHRSQADCVTEARCLCTYVAHMIVICAFAVAHKDRNKLCHSSASTWDRRHTHSQKIACIAWHVWNKLHTANTERHKTHLYRSYAGPSNKFDGRHLFCVKYVVACRLVRVHSIYILCVCVCQPQRFYYFKVDGKSENAAQKTCSHCGWQLCAELLTSHRTPHAAKQRSKYKSCSSFNYTACNVGWHSPSERLRWL